jgi:hypothetical protein
VLQQAGAATAVLFPLALLGWRDWKRWGNAAWSHWFPASKEWLAPLVGEDADTVRKHMAELEALGLAETRTLPDPTSGHRTTRVRLHRRCYAAPEEDYRAMPGAWAFGGWWGLLPSSWDRHLLLCVALADPIRDAERYLESVADAQGVCLDDEEAPEGEDDIRWSMDRRRQLAVRNREAPASLADWQAFSGAARSTVRASFARLAKPLHPWGARGVRVQYVAERSALYEDEPAERGFLTVADVIEERAAPLEAVNSREGRKAFRTAAWGR